MLPPGRGPGKLGDGEENSICRNSWEFQKFGQVKFTPAATASISICLVGYADDSRWIMKRPPALTLLRICEVFRVPVSRLLQGLDKGIY